MTRKTRNFSAESMYNCNHCVKINNKNITKLIKIHHSDLQTKKLKKLNHLEILPVKRVAQQFTTSFVHRQKTINWTFLLINHPPI